MLIRYNGDPTEVSRGGGLSNTSTDVYGRTFRMGDVVDISDLRPDYQKKLANNPAFEVVDSVQIESIVAGEASVEVIPPAPKGKGKRAATDASEE